MNQQSKYILLVEDNIDDELLTIRALKKNNFTNRIVTIHDGLEALDYLRDTSQMPQVILLDLNLPKINGLEVLHSLRSNHHTKLIPVVILTSSKEEQDICQSYAYGANSYIRKTVDFDEFVKIAKYIGLYWLSINESPF